MKKIFLCLVFLAPHTGSFGKDEVIMHTQEFDSQSAFDRREFFDFLSRVRLDIRQNPSARFFYWGQLLSRLHRIPYEESLLRRDYDHLIDAIVAMERRAALMLNYSTQRAF